MSITEYISWNECSPSPSITIIHNYKLNQENNEALMIEKILVSEISRHNGLMISFMLSDLAIRAWIWLASEEIDHSSH